MRRLFPAPRPDETSVTPETLEALAEVYAYPAGGPDGRPWLRATVCHTAMPARSDGDPR